MKKDLIFAPILLVIGVVLFMLKATGLTAHIAVSVVGIPVLIAYTVLTKKEWRIPALEIAMRACYGIALISGVLVMNAIGAAAVFYLHRISAAVFVIALVVLFVIKAIAKKKA